MAQKKWLEKAAALSPVLFRHAVRPQRMVRMERDPGAFQGWRVDDLGSPGAAYAHDWNRSDEMIFDFGEYCVGYLSFVIEADGIADSPFRLQVVLGEVPAELGEDFAAYQGSLSRGWLQEEILVLDLPAGTVRLPRRYAFRYVRFSATFNSSYKVRIKDVSCEAVTSADVNAVAPLPDDVPPSLRRIDSISLNTLKNCMQTVFEDGPKRDRRLWLGDFRLQALVNYNSFRNYDLCKRCLYLFAGLADERGLISSCLYESPQPRRGESLIYDYTALFAPTLLEYAQASDDWETAAELWPVAVRQLEIVLEDIDAQGLFQDRGKWWLFIDWSDGLDRQAAEQGVVIFSLKKACELGRVLDRGKEVAVLEKRISQMSRTTVEKLFDARKNLFVSGRNRQVSWASQVWMTLAGVLPPDDAAGVLSAVAAEPGAVKPGGPYLYHYVVEAMLASGMKTEANALLEKYWGAMVGLGADNFWEVFDPQNHCLSPYGSHLINSYCHAWSCTPSYFLR
ncbi:MAG: hypothetical protein WCV67_21380, partial [Victivallaceae bacterium]